jgi:hypothetical protein
MLLATLIAIPLLLIWAPTLVDIVLRVAFACGEAGRLARIVKLADLDDHIVHAWVPGRPPYEWARRHVAAAAARAV